MSDEKKITLLDFQKLRVTIDAVGISRCLDFIGHTVRSIGTPEEIALRLELAGDEVLSNIAHYAYEKPETGWVEVTFEIQIETLRMTFTDAGCAFNLLNKEPFKTEEAGEDRNPGGLGIHIVRSLFSDVIYRRENDLNILSIGVRYRDP